MQGRIMEKLKFAQLVKKFFNFYGNQRFITVISRACHWSFSSNT
jgi:hypothetical protein